MTSLIIILNIKLTIPFLGDKNCRPKYEIGLNIRKIEDTNAAFLVKQCWKNLTQPDNICDKVNKSK